MRRSGEAPPWSFVHRLFSKESFLRRVHGGALHGWFITLVDAQTQTDWEWVEQSLSFSCLGKSCHHFRCMGGGVSGCCSILPFPDSDICQIFQLLPLCAVQRESEDLRLLQAEATIVEASKVARCWPKMFYANSHQVTPIDSTGSHGADGRMAHNDNFHIHVCRHSSSGLDLCSWTQTSQTVSLSWCLQREPC